MLVPDHLREMIARVADSDVCVVLRGERGVGKEVVAREVHARSSRRDGPFVRVHCGTLPSTLIELESELFGHEPGALGPASEGRAGLVEAAHGGSLLLDELSAIPLSAQVKLLQVLQDHEVLRVGSVTPRPINVRVFAATDRNVDRLLHAGSLRADVYYHLQVIEIHVPPLRERRDEILPLAEHFIAHYSRLYQRPPVTLDAAAREALVRHNWPGNIRELENLIRRVVLLQDASLLPGGIARHQFNAVQDAPVEQPRPPAASAPSAPGSPDRGLDLQSLARDAALRAERDAIDRALARFHWNRRKAAEFLNVSYKTLLNKMKECGISDVAPAEPAVSRHARGNL